jgi:hypothetical protein
MTEHNNRISEETISAIEAAARSFPKIGYNKGDQEIWISMRDDAISRLSIGEAAPEGWIRINVLGVLQLEKKPLVDAITAMDDENFKYNQNGRYNIHLEYSEFKNARIVEGGKPQFVPDGNHFSSDIDHLILSIDCAAFVNAAELDKMGGGVPSSSDFADAREEAQECGEDPDTWIEEMMKVAEDNIGASLQTIIIFDELIQGDSIDALLIDYQEA